MSHRPLAWLSFALLTLVLLAWLWPLLGGETLFWGLPALQFYPWRSFGFDEIRAGRLPLWNPYNGNGAPLLANYQSALLYPPNWLHLLLPHVTAMNLLAVGHIVWAGAGLWRFAAAWSLPGFACGVSMLAFALGGYLIARLGSFPTVAAASWLPWLFLAVHRLVACRATRDMVSLALAVAMLLLAGHAQTAYYALLGAAVYALWLGWQLQTGRGAVAAWARVVAAVLLGAGLAAMQLLPTAQLLALSDRAAGLDYNWVTNFSYSPVRALNMLSPNIFGTPADGSYFTEGAYFEDAAYIGLLPTLAAGFAVLAWFQRRRELRRPPVLSTVPLWTAMAAVSFLIALGKNGPLFPLLYRAVPTFAAFQGPVRWLVLTVFALSMLAGIGVAYGWQTGRWAVFWSRLLVAAGLGTAVVALAATELVLRDMSELRVMSRGLASFGVLVSLCAALSLAQPQESHLRRRLAWSALALVFVAFDLFWAFRGLNPTVPAAFFRPFAVPSGPEAGMFYMTEDTQRRLMFEEFFPLDDYRVAVERWPELRTSLLPNLNLLDRVPMLNNFDPLVPEAYAEAVDALEAGLPEDATLISMADPPDSPSFGQDALLVGAAVSGLSLLLCVGLWAGGSAERPLQGG